MLGPVLQKFGSKEQQDYWLPRILNGDDWWCQGYSEPGAGSDLASLRCEAVRDGDHYVVNGQKTWTTLGQHANMIFCLVRTNATGKKQEGIIFRHLLRLILLCGEFAQVCPEGMAKEEWEAELRDLSDRLTASCRAVDPASTDEVIQQAHAADVVEGETAADQAAPPPAEKPAEPGPAFGAGVWD